MKITINNINVNVAWAEVEINLDKLTRQFTIKNIEVERSFNIGDKVVIYNANNELLIKADIEYLGIERENCFVYAGRNKAKYIADCFADETIQFSEGQTFKEVLENIAGKFGLTVTGDADMPKDTIKTVLIGENLGLAFMDMAKSSGQFLISDAMGNIEIEKKSKKGGEELIYGQNIRGRSFKTDSTKEFNKYVVVSQSNYLTKQDQDVNVRGSFGNGQFIKVIVSKDNLTENECDKLAKIEFYKDRRKSVVYSIEVDSDIKVKINNKYSITDKTAGIKKIMNVRKYTITLSEDTYKTRLVFEDIKND